MKAKRIVLMIFVFTMMFGASVYADSLWGSYEGYQKVKVRVNGSDLKFGEADVPAFSINGRTVLPLRQTADAMQAMLKWNEKEKTAELYKPNVHMFFAKELGKTDYSLIKPFSKVDHGNTVSFVAFIQIDNLKISPKSFKLTIIDPKGKEVGEPVVVPMEDAKETFWFTWLYKVNFDQTGDYTVKFAFENNGDYAVVSEKVIVSE